MFVTHMQSKRRCVYVCEGDPCQAQKRVQLREPSGRQRQCSSGSFLAIQTSLSKLDDAGYPIPSGPPSTISSGTTTPISIPRPSTLSTSTSRKHVAPGSPPAAESVEADLPHASSQPTNPSRNFESMQALVEAICLDAASGPSCRVMSAPCVPASEVWNVPMVAASPGQQTLDQEKQLGRLKMKTLGSLVSATSGFSDQQHSPLSSQASLVPDLEGSGRSRSRFRVLNVEESRSTSNPRGGPSNPRGGPSSSYRGGNDPSASRPEQP